MSIEAEIDARVTAFVTDLMDLVRRMALESVQEALSELDAPPTSRSQELAALSRRSGPASARLRAPAAPESARPRAPVPAAAKGPLSQRSAAPPASVRPLPVTAKPQAGAPGAPARPVQPVPPVVVRRLPPKRRRVARAAPPPPPPPPPVEAAEPQPAKRWVVVRRPAKDKSEAAPAEAGGAMATAAAVSHGIEGATPASPGAPATPVNGVSTPVEQAPATTKVPSVR